MMRYTLTGDHQDATAWCHATRDSGETPPRDSHLKPTAGFRGKTSPRPQ